MNRWCSRATDRRHGGTSESSKRASFGAEDGGMTAELARFKLRLLAQRDEYARLGLTAPAGKLLDDVLAQLDEALRTAQQDLLTLDQAAQESGYSAEHLGRLLRGGVLPNAGRKGAPLICRGDLPQKAGALRATGTDDHALSRRRIALAVAHPDSKR